MTQRSLLKRVLVARDALFHVFGASFARALLSAVRVALVDRVAIDHFVGLDLHDLDAGLFGRLRGAEEEHLGPTGLITFGDASNLIVRLSRVVTTTTATCFFIMPAITKVSNPSFMGAT